MNETFAHAPENQESPEARVEKLITAFTDQMTLEIRETVRLARAAKQHEHAEGGLGFEDDLALQLEKMKQYYEETLAKALELGEASVQGTSPQGELGLQ